MPDNTPQAGSDTIASDELATLNGVASTVVKAQRVKVGYGDDGIYRDVSEAFPLPVRDRQDANRQPVSLLIDNIAAVATEALISYGGFSNGAALTAGTTAFTVPAGRVFRITSVTLVVQGTALATQRARIRADAALATNPLTKPHYAHIGASHGANAGGSESLAPAGDGIEIGPGLQVGITAVGVATTTYSLSVVGFTYIP